MMKFLKPEDFCVWKQNHSFLKRFVMLKFYSYTTTLMQLAIKAIERSVKQMHKGIKPRVNLVGINNKDTVVIDKTES